MTALDALADAGWPALERVGIGDWVARFSSGVTERANSVWVRGAVDDLDAAIDRAERMYRVRALPPIFQLAHGGDRAVAKALSGRGYRAIARRILTGAPALYARVDDADEVAAVGRLALVGTWGGLFVLATRPDACRRGHARTVIQALAAGGAEAGVERLWLQVLAGNDSARRLYSSLGFVGGGGYDYFAQAPRR